MDFVFVILFGMGHPSYNSWFTILSLLRVKPKGGTVGPNNQYAEGATFGPNKHCTLGPLTLSFQHGTKPAITSPLAPTLERLHSATGTWKSKMGNSGCSALYPGPVLWICWPLGSASKPRNWPCLCGFHLLELDRLGRILCRLACTAQLFGRQQKFRTSLCWKATTVWKCKLLAWLVLQGKTLTAENLGIRWCLHNPSC